MAALGNEREQALKAVWNNDAPQGKAYKCPDCAHWATLGGNAGFHAKGTGHGVPTLVPIETVNKPGSANSGLVQERGHPNAHFIPMDIETVFALYMAKTTPGVSRTSVQWRESRRVWFASMRTLLSHITFHPNTPETACAAELMSLERQLTEFATKVRNGEC